MRHLMLLSTIVVSALASYAAEAANLSFMGDAPVAYMTDEDIRLFQEAADKALDDTVDGDSVTWSNPKTDAGGEITLLRTDDSHAMLCRIVRVQNRAGGRENRGVYRACKDTDGAWRLAAAGVTATKPEQQPKPEDEE